MKNKTALLAMMLIAFSATTTVFAQETAQSSGNPITEVEKTKGPVSEPVPENIDVPADNKSNKIDGMIAEHEAFAQKVYEEIKEIAVNLKGENQKHFMMLYSNYNMIGAVKTVFGDVGAAVKACDEANPAMKAELDARHKEWKEALDPIVKEADANISNMIKAQDYAPADKITKIMESLSELRKKTMAQIEKKPVTTVEACEYLKGKMAETRESLANALRSTLVSVGKAFPPDTPPAASGETKDESKITP
jgi:hypothetical protein